MDAKAHSFRVGWQNVACPLCDARSEETLLETPWRQGEAPFRLVRCRRCDMGYLNPRPDESSIGHFYTPDYEWYQVPERPARPARRLRARLERLVMSRCYGTPPPLRGLSRRLLALAATPWLRPDADSMTALPYRGAGRLLEYGCGCGWYGHRMRQLGWDVTAMDFSADACAVAARFGLKTIVGTLPHPQVAAEAFDVVTMGAVLEHVHWPHRVIAAAAEALRPGGSLVVSVPNLASWGFRAFGPDWWGLQLPHHLLHFTPATLTRLLEAHGLHVDRLRLLRKPGWMRRSLSAAVRRPRLSLLRRLMLRTAKQRLVSGLLTGWTVRTGQGDCLQAIASRRS
jgi:2-polyprenyl-3-methyl-5-hydroxy-6-metoxy-1,4-benzoquinol methylase